MWLTSCRSLRHLPATCLHQIYYAVEIATSRVQYMTACSSDTEATKRLSMHLLHRIPADVTTLHLDVASWCAAPHCSVAGDWAESPVRFWHMCTTRNWSSIPAPWPDNLADADNYLSWRSQFLHETCAWHSACPTAEQAPWPSSVLTKESDSWFNLICFFCPGKKVPRLQGVSLEN
jgi:hypothetical protein